MSHALYVMQVQTVSGKKHGVSPDFTLAHMTQLIMPQHANSLGITFGGQVCRSAAHHCAEHAYMLVSFFLLDCSSSNVLIVNFAGEVEVK